ncbi:kinesin-like protein KIN-14C isoform X3 [Zingiber officinale]|uniref:kinesin-like protein KIN-14C isoform X3 n=1 Tax=Zingiber officinale TaxID=94328 RepID=UPI001C4D065C|nr:kinesin-like protein KIN-14C isoform X3 [Zingiber officinale]
MTSNMETVHVDAGAVSEKRRSDLIRWLNTLFVGLNMPTGSSEEELRALLLEGSVFCGILSRISPIFSEDGSPEKRLINIKKFISVVEEMGFPSFRLVDLEQASISRVVECLLSIRDHLNLDVVEVSPPDLNQSEIQLRKTWKFPKGSSFEFRRGHNFHEVFQLRQGHNSGLTPAKVTENAPTQSLLSITNGILDESIERKNGEISQHVAFLLRRVMQEIERRILTQAEHIRNQNNLIKAREGKYLLRIRVLEELARGTHEENQIIMNQLLLIKAEKNKIVEREKNGKQDMIRLSKTKEDMDNVIAELKRELEMSHKNYARCCQEMEDKTNKIKGQLDKKTKEVEFLLEESKKKIGELEETSKSQLNSWQNKENKIGNFIHSQLQLMQDLMESSSSIKQEIIHSQTKFQDEIINLGLNLKVLSDAADNYHKILAENHKFHNEVQELKGNIRVYCRIRPFLSDQNAKSTTIYYFGDNGELLIRNPYKQGKDGHRMFKFNKVFGPTASQAEIFSDIQPLIRSVLDGYNVCIFAYGQTGSGKTYTMSGPNLESMEDWGVNYRALNDLFEISERRRNNYLYEVGVQMVEIYNEQARDLLSGDGSHKRLGIWSITQPNGLVVPDASMHPVKSTSDVLQLMHIGQTNRAVVSTVLNERSSRSHSILTIHCRGVDLKIGSTSRGCLHLIDLAGSERVEHSEATGDRVKEEQYINKSLSALGDVIFALAQKSTHVPYRNSKLTQILQSSLGKQAKTLMFVQINPDNESYSETISTLKFAERVSGVELGPARSNKDDKDVKDLLEQVAFLKDTISRKDVEIEQMQMLIDHQTVSHESTNEKYAVLGHSSSTPGIRPSEEETTSSRLPHGMLVTTDNFASYLENQTQFSENDDTSNGGDKGQILQAGSDLVGYRDADLEDRISDISDSVISMMTETDGSVTSSTDFSLSPGTNKSEEKKTGKLAKFQSRFSKTVAKVGQSITSRTKLKEPSNSGGTSKATSNSNQATATMKPTKHWH